MVIKTVDEKVSNARALLAYIKGRAAWHAAIEDVDQEVKSRTVLDERYAEALAAFLKAGSSSSEDLCREIEGYAAERGELDRSIYQKRKVVSAARQSMNHWYKAAGLHQGGVELGG